ncbi:MAG: Dna2/Cas4 domain-containing protein [Candidatus Aenigmarchaeota archaeon]|nr:Dna2/Cas4 domain-containing protein [Candidatus Aenigmarchaeota archaeon]
MINFDELINSYLSRDFRPKEVGRYYPSEIGNCLRKVWYSYKYPKDVEPKLLKIFEVGNILHNFVVDVLESEKNPDVKLIESELPVKIKEKNFIISGRIDDVIVVESLEKKFLVEVKSCKFLPMEGPQDHHVMQLNLYMHASGIHDGILLYIQKDDLESRVFNIEYDEALAEKTLKRFEDLHRYLTNDEIPPPEAKMNPDMSWMCKFCDYKDRCEKE